MKLLHSFNRFKRCVILFAVAYIASMAFLGGDYDHTSRSLQDGKGELVVSSDTDILVIVMGERKTFSLWLERIGPINGSLSLLFGSFDEQIPTSECQNENDLPCQVAFIPGTTWTEGRNLLAGEALRKEKRRGKKYDYWLFLDDDVDGNCQGGKPMVETLGEGSCWQKIFNYIGSDQVPEHASSISLPRDRGRAGFASHSTTDAMFSAFKRDRVPYFLPYADLKVGSSQWTSQAALFCIMRTCFKSSSVLVPYVGGRNQISRDYIRGNDLLEIRETIADNFHDEKAGFYPCTDYKPTDIIQGLDAQGIFKTAEELNDNIPPNDLEYCDPMKSRFDRWAELQLASEPLEGYMPSINEPVVAVEASTQYSLPEEFQLGSNEEINILVMVTGASSAFPWWKQRLEIVYGSVSLIYGSFDAAIPEDACHNGFNFDCQVAFIPSATWTDGRNLLAAEAIRKERMIGKQYDYWIFLDDETNVHCGPVDELVEHERLGSGSCWQEIFSFISSDNVPENASAISIPQANGRNGFEAVSTTDATFAAYKRDRVPYLLPFATPREGTSQWNSQAALFCIMRTCMKSSTVHIPYVKTLPPFHFFVQEPSLDEIRDTIVTNYHDDEAGFHPCADFSQDDLIMRGGDKTEAYATGDELNIHIPVPEYDLCEPLKKRFEAWEGQIR